MSEALKYFEIIEAYSEGKMSPEDNIAFETRLLEDKELKNELDLYKAIVSGIKESGEEKLKTKLKLVDQEMDSSLDTSIGPYQSNRKNRYWAIAASVFLIIGAFVFLKYFQEPKLSSLADKYYEREKGLPVEMGTESSPLDQAMNAYKNSDFVGSKKFLHEVISNNRTNDTLNYLLGVTLYELGDYKGADECLVQIKGTSVFYEKSQYRELLIFLKTNNEMMVNQTVKTILENKDHLYYDKVSELKSELSD